MHICHIDRLYLQINNDRICWHFTTCRFVPIYAFVILYAIKIGSFSHKL